VRQRIRLAKILTTSALLFAWTASASAAVRLDPVMIAGDVAPGTGGATFLATFRWPYINNQNDVAFEGVVSGGGENDFGIWVGKRNNLEIIGREGQLAPDGSGLHFNSFSGLWIQGLADDRAVLYLAYLDQNDPGVTEGTDDTIWFGSPDNQDLVYRAPQFSQVPLFYFTADGRVGSGPELFGEPGNLLPVIPPNYSPPGAGDDQIVFTSPHAINDVGQMSAIAYLNDPETAPGYCCTGAWFFDANAPAQVQKIAVGTLSGDEGITPAEPAPGTPHLFHQFYATTLNNQGRVALMATVDAPENQTGIWTWQAGQLDLLVREGDPAPITGESLTIANFTANTSSPVGPQINGRNEVMFLAQLAGAGVDATNDRAMFIGESTADLRLIAREGSQAPGLDEGVVFEKFSRFDFGPYNEPALNARGQVLFPAILAGPGVDQTNDNSYWVTTPSGRLLLVAREGDYIELAPGISGYIYAIDVAPAVGGEDGRGMAINDRGKIALSIIGSDGSVNAVVIATIPEPSPFVLAICAVACALSRARRFS
jgi:hypothetical protein